MTGSLVFYGILGIASTVLAFVANRRLFAGPVRPPGDVRQLHQDAVHELGGRGLKWAWIFFVMSLFTSLAFAIAMFLAFMERQLRYNRSLVASSTA
ncbi:MAG: hypothetical protein ABSG39_06705 [Acidimicrobiales bacterium]